MFSDLMSLNFCCNNRRVCWGFGSTVSCLVLTDQAGGCGGVLVWMIFFLAHVVTPWEIKMYEVISSRNVFTFSIQQPECERHLLGLLIIL